MRLRSNSVLRLLLDENISQEVATQILEKRPEVHILSIHHWHDGAYKGRPDEIVLKQASEEDLTLVTYDKASVIRILQKWGSMGASHAGVLFVDRRAVSSSDLGGLVNSLIAFWDSRMNEDWTNLTDYLTKHM